jgi:hypothetical protein
VTVVVSPVVVVNGSVTVVCVFDELVTGALVDEVGIELADVIASVVVTVVDDAAVVGAADSVEVVCGIVIVVEGVEVDVVPTDVTCDVVALVEIYADDVGETTVELSSAEVDGTAAVEKAVDCVVGSDDEPVVVCSPDVAVNF